MSKEPRRQLRRPMFQREERRELRTQLSVGIAELLSWAIWIMPPPLRTFFADRAGDVFLRFSKTYTGNVEANVRQVLGPDVKDEEVKSVQQSIFRSSARNFADLLTMPRRTRESFKQSVVVSQGSWEIIERAIASGTGVVIVTGHVGCFDFIGQTFWARGYAMKVITGRTTSRFIFDGVTHLRGAKGQEMVQLTPSGVRDVLRTLRNGGSTVLLTDRDFLLNGRPVTFFGQQTTLPPGAVRMARDSGAQIVFVFTRRVGHGKHEIVIKEPFTISKTSNVDADLDEGMATLVQHLEGGIRDAINQWAMFQRVWPEGPPVPLRVFPVGSPLESELLEKVATALPARSAPGERRPLLDRLFESESATEDRKSESEINDQR